MAAFKWYAAQVWVWMAVLASVLFTRYGRELMAACRQAVMDMENYPHVGGAKKAMRARHAAEYVLRMQGLKVPKPVIGVAVELTIIHMRRNES